ncbi:MAG: hypothetical protein WA418_21545 [Bradyrhizobium sp.]
MAAPTFEETLEALLSLAKSDTPLTPAPVDDLVDPYLVGFGTETHTRRQELAEAFSEKAEPTHRSELIHKRIMHAGIIP